MVNFSLSLSLYLGSELVDFFVGLLGRGFGHFGCLCALVHVVLLLRRVVVVGCGPMLRCCDGAVDVVARDDVHTNIRSRTQRIRPHLLLFHFIHLRLLLG